MKIHDISQNIDHIKSLDPSTGTKHLQTSPEGEKAIPAETEVNLSGRSVEFSRATEMMHKVPEDRIQKIEELNTKVKDGSYDIPATDIAAKILDDALTNIVNPE